MTNIRDGKKTAKKGSIFMSINNDDTKKNDKMKKQIDSCLQKQWGRPLAYIDSIAPIRTGTTILPINSLRWWSVQWRNYFWCWLPPHEAKSPYILLHFRTQRNYRDKQVVCNTYIQGERKTCRYWKSDLNSLTTTKMKMTTIVGSRRENSHVNWHWQHQKER